MALSTAMREARRGASESELREREAAEVEISEQAGDQGGVRGCLNDIVSLHDYGGGQEELQRATCGRIEVGVDSSGKDIFRCDTWGSTRRTCQGASLYVSARLSQRRHYDSGHSGLAKASSKVAAIASPFGNTSTVPL